MTTAQTVALTDPARELAELCDGIRDVGDNQTSGENHLASKFGVDAWSRDFYEIIFVILKRIDLVKSVVDDLELDGDFKADIAAHLTQVSQAFSPSALRNTWVNHGAPYLEPANVQPLKAISGQVRQRLSYRKLTSDEVSELNNEIVQLIVWLEEHQLSEQDFIRQALIEGLEALWFRLQRLQWLGWGYALESLKEVISAYMMLEGSSGGASVNPDAEAVLKRTLGVIQSVFSKVKMAKDVSDAANWMLSAYGAVTLIQKGTPAITALLAMK